MRSLIQQLALSCALVGALSACATPPAQDFEHLCAQEAGLVVYERARLPAERFTPAGRVIELKGHPSNFYGPYYTVKTRETELGADRNVRRIESNLYRKSDGKLMATRTWFIKRGPYVLGFEPKVYTCPAAEDATLNPAFIR